MVSFPVTTNKGSIGTLPKMIYIAAMITHAAAPTSSNVQGRGGKGNIYVWAAGNGGLNFDSCAADGYVSSIYTIAVGSADQNARQADYDEQCASKMAVTFSYNSDTFPNTSKQKPYNQVVRG